jgi:hypothetical protein
MSDHNDNGNGNNDSKTPVLSPELVTAVQEARMTFRALLQQPWQFGDSPSMHTRTVQVTVEPVPEPASEAAAKGLSVATLPSGSTTVCQSPEQAHALEAAAAKAKPRSRRPKHTVTVAPGQPLAPLTEDVF